MPKVDKRFRSRSSWNARAYELLDAKFGIDGSSKSCHCNLLITKKKVKKSIPNEKEEEATKQKTKCQTSYDAVVNDRRVCLLTALRV